jgi:hypothetical protein
MNVFDCVIYKFLVSLLKRVDLAVDPTVEAINLAAAYFFCFLKCPNCCPIRLFLHYAFRHSQASIMSSTSWLLSGVTSFFALLKTRSYSVDIAEQHRVSRGVLKGRREVRVSGIVDCEANSGPPSLLPESGGSI